MRGLLRLAGVVVVAVLALAGPAAAHPLGNFTVNHLTRITVERGVLHARYVLDLAEIPAFTLDRSLDPHGTPSPAQLDRWAASDARSIAPQLQLTVDRHTVTLVPRTASVRQRPGVGGLPTLYVTLAYSAAIGAGAHRLTYRDTTEPGRLGWKDIVTGATREPTNELRSYPSALLGSPRALTAIAARVDAAGGIIIDPTGAGIVAAPTPVAEAPAPPSPSLDRSSPLSDILAKGASDPWIVGGAFLLAIALGALHALEPGHGKTLLAVSLVGARATTRQAIILACALTVAHTAGVLAIGVVLLSAVRWLATEHVYPWLEMLSGMVVTTIGGRALAREVRLRLPFAHVHEHGHPRAHPHAHDHVHAPGEGHDHLDDIEHARAHAIPGTAPLTFRSAVLAAASANVAPCPAAIIVLLAAVTSHHIGYGLALIVAFSVGLAAVLTVLGIAVVRSAAWLVARPQFDRVAHFAPLVTAFIITTIGAVMIGRALADLGVVVSVPLVAALILLAVVGYAFAWHRHETPAEARA